MITRLIPPFVTALGTAALAAVIGGFEIEGVWALVATVVAVFVVNAAIWPALRRIVAPIGVLTLGLGAIVVNALVVWAVLAPLRGVTIDGFWTALMVTIGLTVLSTITTALFAVHDDAWFDRRTAQRAHRRADQRGQEPLDGGAPGLVVVQLDGLARPVLERAIRSGDAPTLAAWLRDGSHQLHTWIPEWSCQTGVSQCGILHGDVHDMPAFRWFEKDTGRILVSNHPRDAAEIQRRHSTTPGLLAHHGSSYGNLFSGDAERAAMTMSVLASTKEGRIASGYGRYFAQPYQTIRTAGNLFAEVARERRAARDQIRRDVQPRVSRSWSYAFLRAFTTVISRDVSLAGVLDDMAEGRSIIYVDFLGYDEVAHHSGPERHDTLRVVRGLDRDLARIDRARSWCRRPYEIVVLSDHGQTQGATFADRYGTSLDELIASCTGGADTGRDARQMAETESSAILRAARGNDVSEEAGDSTTLVLASGNLALVSFTDVDRRMTLQDIDAAHPTLVHTLVHHPGIGFVLVQCAERGNIAIGASGWRSLDQHTVEGDDPLAPFGPHAVEQVARVAGYRNLPDLMINSLYEPATGEVAAFEHQVSSHGGLGGNQQEPFLMVPAALSAPASTLVGPVAVHHQIKRWLGELGQPITV